MVNRSTHRAISHGVMRKGWAALGKRQRGSLWGGGRSLSQELSKEKIRGGMFQWKTEGSRAERELVKECHGDCGWGQEGGSLWRAEKIGKDFGLSLKGSGELLEDFKPERNTI